MAGTYYTPGPRVIVHVMGTGTYYTPGPRVIVHVMGILTAVGLVWMYLYSPQFTCVGVKWSEI
jgi:hypothetical protein